jgi:hypothetical protein
VSADRRAQEGFADVAHLRRALEAFLDAARRAVLLTPDREKLRAVVEGPLHAFLAFHTLYRHLR